MCDVTIHVGISASSAVELTVAIGLTVSATTSTGVTFKNHNHTSQSSQDIRPHEPTANTISNTEQETANQRISSLALITTAKTRERVHSPMPSSLDYGSFPETPSLVTVKVNDRPSRLKLLLCSVIALCLLNYGGYNKLRDQKALTNSYNYVVTNDATKLLGSPPRQNPLR